MSGSVGWRLWGITRGWGQLGWEKAGWGPHAPWKVSCHLCYPYPIAVRRYGPFWVATTLIFVTAASGNLSSYISYRKALSTSPPSPRPPGPPGSVAVPAPPSASADTAAQWYADSTKVWIGGHVGI